MPWARGSTRQTRKQRQTVLNRDNHQCQIAGPNCTGTATEDDHITPISQGGTNDLTNHQAACTKCHHEKSRAEATAGSKRNPTHRQPEPPPGLH